MNWVTLWLKFTHHHHVIRRCVPPNGGVVRRIQSKLPDVPSHVALVFEQSDKGRRQLVGYEAIAAWAGGGIG